MAKFDYKRAKDEIAEINAIVETCPDAVKEKCFELLFAQAFGTATAAPAPKPEQPAAPKLPEEPEKPAAPQSKKLPGNIVAFMRKSNVTEEELGKLFMIDHDPLLAIYKLPTKQSHAQLYKVLLILLENGLLNNALSAPYAELRDSVKEDGLMDGNFTSTLKRNHTLFRGAINDDTIDVNGVVELTGAGMQRLAEIVKELAAG
jgi:hypothetical protein